MFDVLELLNAADAIAVLAAYVSASGNRTSAVRVLPYSKYSGADLMTSCESTHNKVLS